MWKKGASGNPKGSVKGAVKKRRWETLEYWMMLLNCEMNRLIYVQKTHKDGTTEKYSIPAVSADTRAKIMADMFKVILARKAKAPQSQSESVSNVNDALKALSELTGDGANQKSNGSTGSVDARSADVQAEPNPAQHEKGLGDEQGKE